MANGCWQTRCVHCKLEQYGPSVQAVSLGQRPCAWCGHLSKAMTMDEYRAALALPKSGLQPDIAE